MGRGKLLATVFPPVNMRDVLVLMVVALWVYSAAAHVQLWYSVQVSRATLKAETPRVVSSSTRLMCAIRAAHDPRAYLLCPEDTCALYSLRIGAGHDDTVAGPTDPCWTKLSCTMDGRGYGEGEIRRAETGDQWVYQDRRFVPFFETSTTSAIISAFNTTLAPTGTTASDMRFSELLEGGYVYMETSEMTWDDARANCRKRGGDLMVVTDFSGLEQYMEDFDITEVWIGARSLHWLDGRVVTSDKWASSEPNDDENACIKLKRYDTHIYLYDRKCSATYESLCRLGAQYP